MNCGPGATRMAYDITETLTKDQIDVSPYVKTDPFVVDETGCTELEVDISKAE
jgi:hypothetical protein